jgi:hypothetical protein
MHFLFFPLSCYFFSLSHLFLLSHPTLSRLLMDSVLIRVVRAGDCSPPCLAKSSRVMAVIGHGTGPAGI